MDKMAPVSETDDRAQCPTVRLDETTHPDKCVTFVRHLRHRLDLDEEEEDRIGQQSVGGHGQQKTEQTNGHKIPTPSLY